MKLKQKYWKAIEIVLSEYRNAKENLLPYYNFNKQRFNGRVFSVEILGEIGLFAQLNWCLFVLSYCEKTGKVPNIVLSNPLYVDKNRGNDWFKYFFINNIIENSPEILTQREKMHWSTIKGTEFKELGLSKKYYQNMTIEEGNYLFFKYFSLKKELVDYVNDFAVNNFCSQKTLGLHYRGTDKGTEAEGVSWDYCLKAVEKFFEKNTDFRCLFVATDESRFIDYIACKIKGINLVCHEDKQRSDGNTPVHFKYIDNDNYTKGKEALVNSLLLSKCDYLIRTSSFLSGFSSVFNTKLPVTMLNAPYEGCVWFPDREVLKISNNMYLPG